jgi:PKHD-type hydroxylase
MMIIGNVLDQHEVAALQEAAVSIPFEDGKKTAGRYVREVKQNTQASASSERDAILAKVKKALDAHDVFQSAARPRYYARMLISRYRSGMEYGAHVDDPIINGFRTDLSFTLFLSDADSYQGGGLVIEDAMEARVIRPQAGDAVLYPTSALHRVEPVTAGERLAVVGWVTSWVKSPAEREILYDLDHAARAVFEAQGKTPAFDRLLKVKSNLYRMWADG